MQNLTHKLCESSSLDQLNCILCISRNINNSQNLSCKCFKSLQQLLLFTVKKCLSICVHTHTYTQGNYFSSSAITLSASCANARIIMTSLATKTKKKICFSLFLLAYVCVLVLSFHCMQSSISSAFQLENATRRSSIGWFSLVV